MDDVAVCQYEAVWADDETRAAAAGFTRAALGREGLGGLDSYHGRSDSLDGAHDSLRVSVEQRVLVIRVALLFGRRGGLKVLPFVVRGWIARFGIGIHDMATCVMTSDASNRTLGNAAYLSPAAR